MVQKKKQTVKSDRKVWCDILYRMSEPVLKNMNEGKPLLTHKDCFDPSHSWACIDPAVFMDDDGPAWLFLGNKECYYARLKDNMIELEREIKQIKFNGFVLEEALWVLHNITGNITLRMPPVSLKKCLMPCPTILKGSGNIERSSRQQHYQSPGYCRIQRSMVFYLS